MSDNTAVSVEGEGKLAVNPMLPSPAKPRRNASFELLRILCIFFIIGHHFICHGGWDGVTDEVTAAFIKPKSKHARSGFPPRALITKHSLKVYVVLGYGCSKFASCSETLARSSRRTRRV